MTTVSPLPERSNVRDIVAGEVRAEMSRARVRLSHLPGKLGKSHMYWSRRVNGETAFDVDDLGQLSELLAVPIEAFFARVVAPNGPGPNGVGPAGLEPATYGLQVPGLTDDLAARRALRQRVVPLRKSA